MTFEAMTWRSIVVPALTKLIGQEQHQSMYNEKILLFHALIHHKAPVDIMRDAFQRFNQYYIHLKDSQNRHAIDMAIQNKMRWHQGLNLIWQASHKGSKAWSFMGRWDETIFGRMG